MTSDPFRVLGLRSGASADDVRAARRELARQHHPDAGGDPDVMRQVNVAAADALKLIASTGGSAPGSPDEPSASQHHSSGQHGSGRHATGAPGDDWVGTTRDVPSFTVEALPVETFEALLLATANLGEVSEDDPPYVLRTLLAEPIACWCQLDVVPDAGASTVSVSIAAADGHRLPRLVDVRNAWISALNELDWSSL